jgi:GNAT superfamily N-acetyltransferase
VPTTIRTATLNDKTTLEHIQRLASDIYPEYREALAAHPEAIEVPSTQLAAGDVRIALINNEYIGFSAVIPHEDHAELDGLFVLPIHMGKSIGRLLVDDAAACLASRGIAKLTVTANPNALGFYKKCGFIETGHTQTAFGPGVLMERELVAAADKVDIASQPEP